MADERSDALEAALVRMLRPLARLLLRRGVSFQAFAAVARRAFVDAAAGRFAEEGKKPAVARIAVATGLTRKEVARLLARGAPEDRDSSARYNRAARVISGWRRDPEFKDGRGAPAALPFKGEGPSFAELVRRYSGDMTPRAVLDELHRIGAVKTLRDGRLKLAVRSFVPGAGDAVKLHILGTDVGYLITTIGHNLEAEGESAFFQRKVLYDNLPGEALPEFRALSAEAAQRLLERLDLWLSARDRDNNPGVSGTGRYRAGLGIYYIEEPFREEA
ncbi:MAG: DUF6502 family protein [Desulfobacterales bacterium]